MHNIEYISCLEKSGMNYYNLTISSMGK